MSTRRLRRPELSCSSIFAAVWSRRGSLSCRFIAGHVSFFQGDPRVAPDTNAELQYSPSDLLYAKTHEWVHVDEVAGGKIATIGVSDFAVKALTDLVYIDLPPVGKKL